MSENGKGNTEEVIEFDTLDIDEDKSDSNKIAELQSFLKESLEPDKYTAAMKILGISDDMTNAQLLEKITLLVKKKKEEEEEEKKAAVPAYKDFMKSCMKAGKTMAECAKEFKEKHPPPKKEEESEVEQLTESDWKEEIDLARKKKKDEYEYPEKKAAVPAYKDFMKSCMKAGKSMTECAKEFKEKYPAPKKEEEFEVEELAGSEWKDEIDLARKKKKDEYEYPEKKAGLSPEVRKELDDLKLELGRIKEEKRLMEITHRVDEQIQEKHLAPKQRDQVIKLMAKLDDSYHDELLGTFATQKFRGFEDAGRTDVRRPGAPRELDEETRVKLLKEHGIADLIEERGAKRRVAS